MDMVIVRILQVNLLLNLHQRFYSLIQVDSHMRIFLQTSRHQIQQFRTKTRSLFNVNQVIENAATIETFKRLRKCHAVYIDSEEVDISLDLQLVQLFTC
jgi:hypothetical protein